MVIAVRQCPKCWDYWTIPPHSTMRFLWEFLSHKEASCPQNTVTFLVCHTLLEWNVVKVALWVQGLPEGWPTTQEHMGARTWWGEHSPNCKDHGPASYLHQGTSWTCSNCGCSTQHPGLLSRPTATPSIPAAEAYFPEDIIDYLTIKSISLFSPVYLIPLHGFWWEWWLNPKGFHRVTSPASLKFWDRISLSH